MTDEEKYARLASLMKGKLDWRSGMRDAKLKGLRKDLLKVARKDSGKTIMKPTWKTPEG